MLLYFHLRALLNIAEVRLDNLAMLYGGAEIGMAMMRKKDDMYNNIAAAGLSVALWRSPGW